MKGALQEATKPLTGPVVEEFVDDAYDQASRHLRNLASPRKPWMVWPERSKEIKESLGAGDIKGSLKLGARGLAGPLIDKALDELREELDDQDRLDLVAKAAEQNNETKEEFLDNFDTPRRLIDIPASWLVLLLVVGGVLVMGFIQFPRLATGLRLPGLTLFLSGLVFLITSLILKTVLPGRFDDLLNRADTDPIPPTMVDLISDVLGSMGSNVAGGFITPAITILVIGLVMLVGSFFIRMLHIPFFSR